MLPSGGDLDRNDLHIDSDADLMKKSLQSLLMDRKLIERCVRGQLINAGIKTKSHKEVKVGKDEIYDFLGKVWLKERMAVDSLKEVQRQLRMRIHVLIEEQEESGLPADAELGNCYTQHTLLNRLIELSNSPFKYGDFPIERKHFVLPDRAHKAKVDSGWGFNVPSARAQASTQQADPEPEPKPEPEPEPEPEQISPLLDEDHKESIVGPEMLPPGRLMLPPDEPEVFDPLDITGDDERKKEDVERERLFMDLLSELGVEHFRKIPGRNEAGWRRKHPYNAFLIPPRVGPAPKNRKIGAKLVFLNDGYGQASYIIHDILTVDAEAEIDKFRQHSKQELRALGDHKVSRVIWPGEGRDEKWKETMSKRLEQVRSKKKPFGPETSPDESYYSSGAIELVLKRDYGISKDSKSLLKIIDLVIERNSPPMKLKPVHTHSKKRRKDGSPLQMYSPEVADRVFEICIAINVPNKDWKSESGVFDQARKAMRTAGLSPKLDKLSVRKVISMLLKKGPGESGGIWKKGLYVSRGKKRILNAEEARRNPLGLGERYSPDLVEAAVALIVEQTPIKGWKTMNALSDEIKKIGHGIDWNYFIEHVQRVADKNESYEIKYFRATGPGSQSVDGGPSLKLHMNPALYARMLEIYRSKSHLRRRMD